MIHHVAHARKMSNLGGKIKIIKAPKKKDLMPETSKKDANSTAEVPESSKKGANELVEETLPSQELEEQDVEVEHALGLHQDTIPPMIMEEEIHGTAITEKIHDNVEIHDNADTNIGINGLVLHQVQDIRTEDGETMAVFSDLLPATQSTVVELEDDEDELANDQLFDELTEETSLQDSLTSLQDSQLNKVMVTRDS